MEAKLLIFTYDYVNINDNRPSWDYNSIPLSDTLLYTSHLHTSIPSFQNPHPNRILHLMGELAKLFSDHGALKGWKLYTMEEPIQIESRIYAKVIVTKTTDTVEANTLLDIETTKEMDIPVAYLGN